VCDLETSRMGAPYIYDISRLRFKEVLTQNLNTFVIHPIRTTFLVLLIVLAFMILLIFHGHTKTQSSKCTIRNWSKSKRRCFRQSSNSTFVFYRLWFIHTFVLLVLFYYAFFIRTCCLFTCTYFILAMLKESDVLSKFRIATMYLNAYDTPSLWVYW